MTTTQYDNMTTFADIPQEIVAIICEQYLLRLYSPMRLTCKNFAEALDITGDRDPFSVGKLAKARREMIKKQDDDYLIKINQWHGCIHCRFEDCTIHPSFVHTLEHNMYFKCDEREQLTDEQYMYCMYPRYRFGEFMEHGVCFFIGLESTKYALKYGFVDELIQYANDAGPSFQIDFRMIHHLIGDLKVLLKLMNFCTKSSMSMVYFKVLNLMKMDDWDDELMDQIDEHVLGCILIIRSCISCKNVRDRYIEKYHKKWNSHADYCTMNLVDINCPSPVGITPEEFNELFIKFEYKTCYENDSVYILDIYGYDHDLHCVLDWLGPNNEDTYRHCMGLAKDCCDPPLINDGMYPSFYLYLRHGDGYLRMLQEYHDIPWHEESYFIGTLYDHPQITYESILRLAKMSGVPPDVDRLMKYINGRQKFKSVHRVIEMIDNLDALFPGYRDEVMTPDSFREILDTRLEEEINKPSYMGCTHPF